MTRRMVSLDLDRVSGLLHLFGDPTRVRLMALLERHELTVAELTKVTELAQSRVSTHLGRLREADLLHDRPAGPATFYRVREEAMPAEVRRLWDLLREQLDDAVLDSDRTRAEALVRAREGDGRWPDAVAGEMERHYSPGRTWEALARSFVGLMDPGEVLDVGSGDGTVAQLVAPRARRYVCLDRSPRLLGAARARLTGLAHVELVAGDMHALPFGDARFDHVLLLHTLGYSEAPARALVEAARVLRPGGTLTLSTLAAHGRPAATAVYGHVNAGHAPEDLARLLEDAGLDVDACRIASREKRAPNFEVVTAFAHRPAAAASGAARAPTPGSHARAPGSSPATP